MTGDGTTGDSTTGAGTTGGGTTGAGTTGDGTTDPQAEPGAVPDPVTGEAAQPGAYPQVQPELPPRSRGVIGLLEENCTACMLCARECPDWCLYIESHDEVVEDPAGGRPRTRHVLDRFAIDYGLCMYCGICVEVCPFDALFWSPEFAYAEVDAGELTHERDRLREWMWTVPPPSAAPPATDPATNPATDPDAGTGGVSGSS